MSTITGITIIRLRCGGDPGVPRADAYWNGWEYWSVGPGAVADLARRLLNDGYPSTRGWELHDQDGKLAAGP